jgi:enediyne biosynthesis protein E4
MPEIKSGGVGLLDYDRDGLLDIFCVNGGSLDPSVTNRPGPRLYHNLGHWKFEDVTERAGIGNRGQYGVGCACGDYNGDGWPDIYLNNLGTNLLFRNNGDGTFTDVTAQAGVGDSPSWSVSSAFFDYDNDGNLDLMVVNYLHWSREAELECSSYRSQPDYCSPLNYHAPAMTTLYHNKGDGTFENVTHAAGLDRAYGNGLGVACADFNGDGRCDIFVANDAVPNQLWINQGNGTFVDEAMLRGCAVNAMGVSRAGMGVAVADLKGDGWLDLFVTHLVSEGNGLFLNDHGFFTDTVRPKGPSAPSLPFTGFGVGLFDFDNDGRLDLFVANGRVKLAAQAWDAQDPYAEPNTLSRGLGGLDFEEVLPRGGTDPPLIATSRGAAFGDLDNDGGVDIVVLNRDGPVHLLRNIVAQRGHWILLRLLNKKGTDAIGADLRLEAGARTYRRQLLPNQSYASSNDPRVHCGLGSAQTFERIVVRWPDGNQDTFGPLDADRIYELREGTQAKPVQASD